jgi:hypothetical protein
MRSTSTRQSKRCAAAAVGVFGSWLATPVWAAVVNDAGTDDRATLVAEVADAKGFLFYPSAPPAGAFRFALGGSFDAIDPEVMYGASFRFPQLTRSGRWGGGSRSRRT